MRRKVKEMRKQMGTRHRELIDGLDAIVWEADPQTLRFTFVSQGAGTVLGYPPARWQNEPGFLQNHLHPKDRDETLRLLLAARLPGHSRVLEYRMMAADGSVCWLRNTVSVDVAKGKTVGLRGVMVDVTQSKQAEEEKAKTQAHLARGRRLEALATLAGGVAHDINNVLTAVQGYSDLTRQDLDEGSPLRWNLEQVLGAASRGAGLARQLLLFSSRHPLEFISLDVNATVEQLLRMSDEVLGEAATIALRLQPDLWTVRADRSHIQTAIRNLLANASEAMPEGGTITIKTENLVLSEELATPMLNAKPGKFVRISVADTGTGMTEEAMEHLFEPFFTTKARGKAKGLGLSVAYGIVTQHGGWLNASSQPGHGATFYVYLPVEDSV